MAVSGLAVSGLAVKIPRCTAISLILSANRARKQSFYLVGPQCSVQERFNLPEQLTIRRYLLSIL